MNSPDLSDIFFCFSYRYVSPISRSSVVGISGTVGRFALGRYNIYLEYVNMYNFLNSVSILVIYIKRDLDPLRLAELTRTWNSGRWTLAIFKVS